VRTLPAYSALSRHSRPFIHSSPPSFPPMPGKRGQQSYPLANPVSVTVRYDQSVRPVCGELAGSPGREVRPALWRLRHHRKASMPTPAMAAFRRFELLRAPPCWRRPVLRRPNILPPLAPANGANRTPAMHCVYAYLVGSSVAGAPANRLSIMTPTGTGFSDWSHRPRCPPGPYALGGGTDRELRRKDTRTTAPEGGDV